MEKELTIMSVKEEIKKSLIKCIERYALHNDRFLKDLEGDVILIVDEGFERLEE